MICCDVNDLEQGPDLFNKEAIKKIYTAFFPKQKNYSYFTSGNDGGLEGNCYREHSKDQVPEIAFEIPVMIPVQKIALLYVAFDINESMNNKEDWTPAIM